MCVTLEKWNSAPSLSLPIFIQSPGSWVQEMGASGNQEQGLRKLLLIIEAMAEQEGQLRQPKPAGWDNNLYLFTSVGRTLGSRLLSH